MSRASLEAVVVELMLGRIAFYWHAGLSDHDLAHTRALVTLVSEAVGYLGGGSCSGCLVSMVSACCAAGYQPTAASPVWTAGGQLRGASGIDDERATRPLSAPSLLM